MCPVPESKSNISIIREFVDASIKLDPLFDPLIGAPWPSSKDKKEPTGEIIGKVSKPEEVIKYDKNSSELNLCVTIQISK
ncbi:MAG: hypothetical protein ABIQ02_08300, partial [Saprospiraceae bacterium]